MWDVNLGGLDGIQTQPGWMWNGSLWTWMKVRWYMDGGDIIFFWPGLRWDRKRMPMRCKFWNLVGFETVSLWSWDATWMRVRCNTMDLHEGEMVHGCRWDNDIWILIQWDRSKLDAHLDTRMACGYTLIRIWSGMRLDLDGWRWDVYLRGLMELRRCVGGSDKHGGMFAPKWSWYAIIVTWIKLRCDINASEMLLEWRWDANIGTLMEVRVDMNGCEIYISWPGCSWYKNGLSWDTHFGT